MHTGFCIFHFSCIEVFFIYMVYTCDVFFIVQTNSSFSFQLQVAAILYCTRSLDLLLIFIFGVVFTGQVTGHGAYGEKGQKGEPAVIEPVSTDVREFFSSTV